MAETEMKAATKTGNAHPGAQVQETGAAAAVADSPSIEFDQIQGNIFGGFNKDHQLNVFFKITDLAAAVATLRPQAGGEDVDDSVYTHVVNSSSQQVLAFNEQFRALRRANVPEGTIRATWTNLVFTAKGMRVLKNVDGVDQLPAAFTAGMAGRATVIGDVDAAGGVHNAPAHWNDGMDVHVAWDKVDGLIMVASDDPAQVDRLVAGGRASRYMAKLEAAGSGIEVLGVIHGETRVDDVGHEHFGFKDGVSQPGVRGVDAPDDPLHNPDQGNPGQDLLHPGEFVVGYPKQIATAKEGHDGPNPEPGHIAGKDPNPDPNNPAPNDPDVLPKWAVNGSFLVFRRLAQDVKGFRDAIVTAAGQLGMTSDLLGAKVIGRYRSGAPLEALKFQAGNGEYKTPLTDPGVASPALANSDALNNDFEYGHDADGLIVPISAHIRKAYPRDQIPLHEAGEDNPIKVDKDIANSEAESRTQRHRLLRRGIPFGRSLGAPEGGGPNDPRGLLFLAYQSDIERQFEFVQRAWVNDPNFPRKAGQPNNTPPNQLPAGQDPLITNNTSSGAIRGCPFHALANKAACPVKFHHFVKTRGGGYFFSPSIDTLKAWLTPA